MSVLERSSGNQRRARSIVIVGGGISGLATAYYLQQFGREKGVPLSIHLIERSDRLGGVISTVREDGFIVEGGPDSMLSFKVAGLRLLSELGLEEEIVGTSTQNHGSFIYSRGRLHPLPEGLTLMIPSRLGPLFRTRLISWPGKLRAGMNLLQRRHHNGTDVSVAEFVEAHLGREVFERIVEPLFAGIYAGDARQLSLSATYPQLLDLERQHGSLLRGLLHMRRQRGKQHRQGVSQGSRWTPFITLRTGLLRLVEALEAQLQDVDVHLETEVTRVSREENGSGAGKGQWRIELGSGQVLEADDLVLATPAYAAADLLASVDKTLASTLSQIPYVSSVTVSLAFRREDVRHPLKGYGFVVPRVEARPLLACTWTSSKFPHRAPQGFALFRAFLGRAGQQDMTALSEERLVALALSELRDIMGVDASPTHAWVFRWRRGLPQYTIGHRQRLATIEERLRALPGLFLTGNAYQGVGIPDCIASGRRVAAQMIGAGDDAR